MRRRFRYNPAGGKVVLPRGVPLDDEVVVRAVQSTNVLFQELHKASPHVSALLGMRNLSAFVGSAFATEIEAASDGLLRLNPHQDGYPDLLLLDEVGMKEWSKVEARIRDKAPFSPFPSGGLEIKATCGDVPTETVLLRRGLTKPVIGETRRGLITGLNWKAHHRETNNLMGIIWDFVDGLPTIAVVTYRDDLDPIDWGKIVKPRTGGGRTTSVSIMTRAGVAKMCQNCIVVLPEYEPLVTTLAVGRRRR